MVINEKAQNRKMTSPCRKWTQSWHIYGVNVIWRATYLSHVLYVLVAGCSERTCSTCPAGWRHSCSARTGPSGSAASTGLDTVATVRTKEELSQRFPTAGLCVFTFSCFVIHFDSQSQLDLFIDLSQVFVWV